MANLFVSFKSHSLLPMTNLYSIAFQEPIYLSHRSIYASSVFEDESSKDSRFSENSKSLISALNNPLALYFATQEDTLTQLLCQRPSTSYKFQSSNQTPVELSIACPIIYPIPRYLSIKPSLSCSHCINTLPYYTICTATCGLTNAWYNKI